MMSIVNMDTHHHNHHHHNYIDDCNNTTNNNNNQDYWYDTFELEVANSLLDLCNSTKLPRHNLSLCPSSSDYYRCSNSSNSKFFPNWVSKKRRSVLDSPPSPPPHHPLPTVKIQAEVTSPSTPLSFSPSQEPPPPHHPFNHKRKAPSRLTSEKLKEIYAEATVTQQTLKKEIEGVRSHLTELKARNKFLKAELEKCRVGEAEGRGGVNDQVQAAASTSTQVNNPAPLIDFPRGDILEDNERGEEKVGPRDFDLNIAASAEEQEDNGVNNTTVPMVDEVEERERNAEVARLNRKRRKEKMKQNPQRQLPAVGHYINGSGQQGSLCT